MLISLKENASARKMVAEYAANFLPLLFSNMLTEKNQSLRMQYMETLKVYIAITESKVLVTLYDRTLDRLKGCLSLALLKQVEF